MMRISFLLTLALAARAEDTSESILARLQAGNARHVSGKYKREHQSVNRRVELAVGQHPSVIVLSCSDSRVPPEIVFDQGLGDLFVIRVAGNVVEPAGLASIEYAAEHFHSPVIVVLGHERCGAVDAAVKGGEAPGHIGELVKAIQPAVNAAASKPGDKVDNSVIENVRMMAEKLRTSRPILAELAEKGKIKVVGGRYDLDTGVVTWLQ